MAELKLVRYLREEENLILSMLSKLQQQLNKLKVEEMNIISALRENRFEESTGDAAQASASNPGPSSLADNSTVEAMNIEDINLSVQEELNLLTRAAFGNDIEEEEEDEEDEDFEDEG
ncbi:unnamed protein product [Ixodes persulcatus]